MIGSRIAVPTLFAALLSFAVFTGSADPAEAGPKAKAKVEIKIATIAPDGSTWMRIMDELDTEIRAKTAGEVGLKFYAGGVQGDEAVVLRKIRAGQLHGGGLTGVGLGEIASGLRVMEVPFTFGSAEEVHAVRERMGPAFEQMLRDAGFELLGWSDVGMVYLFTKAPVRSADDLHKLRMWLWEGDPLAQAFLKELGVSPVPLPITDVVTSLQTGLIDGVYTSPMACIALQWFARVSYMTDMPVTHALGAVVVTRKVFDSLSPAAQTTLKESAKTYFAKLSDATDRESVESLGVLKERGVSIVPLAEGDKKAFAAIGATVREKLAGELYSRETLDEMLRILAELREEDGAKRP